MDYLEILKDKEKSKTLARIIAHLMGDGCVTKRYFVYCNKDEYLLETYKKDVLNLFGEIHIITGTYASGTKLIQVQNKKILNFLSSLVNDFRSFALVFPKCLDAIELKKEFLSAIYDDEGTVALRIFRKTNDLKRNLTIASKSKRFMEDIKKILEEDFDIKCNKIGFSIRRFPNKKEFITWNLSITGKENLIKFRDKINFNAPIKRKQLDLMINSYIRK